MLAVSALNPLASALLSRYESLEASYMRNQESKLAVSESGLWLRQADDGGQSVIHAERVRPGSIALQQVIVFRYAEGDRFRDRIDAREAQLEPGRWVLFDAWLSHPGASDRKCVVSGKGVALRLDLGGGRFLKKK